MFEIRGKQKEGTRATAVVERERETADNGEPVIGAKGKGWLSGEGRQKTRPPKDRNHKEKLQLLLKFDSFFYISKLIMFVNLDDSI